MFITSKGSLSRGSGAIEHESEVSVTAQIPIAALQQAVGTYDLEARLTAPGYCYLIALNPDGREQLCWPEDPAAPPPPTQVIDYPQDPTMGFGLTDGVGLQAFVLVVSRDHPLARREKAAFADVLDYDFVGLDRASALQRFLADKASRIGRPLKLRVQLRSFDGVCRLVERNAGIGIVPETTVRWAERSMAIKAVDLTDTWALRDLTICVRDVAALSPFARQLVEHMRGS